MSTIVKLKIDKIMQYLPSLTLPWFVVKHATFNKQAVIARFSLGLC